MTANATRSGIEVQDGILRGPLRAPRNLEKDIPGSIHNDDVAKNLGFRGGTIAGSFHMEQFPPLLLRAFGNRWFETGALSTYFRNATTDGEPVRAFVEAPTAGASDAITRVWMEREDGTLVLEGTASLGAPAAPSYIQRKVSESREAGDQRILSGITAGMEIAPLRTRVTADEAAPRLAVITEPLDWYTGASPWGGPVAHPGLVVHLMYQAQRNIPLRTKAVGLFGAIEVRHLRGPVFVGREYEARGTILAVGQTPKTEYFWYETLLRDPDSGSDVASMTMMLRFMKASSRLWQADAPEL